MDCKTVKYCVTAFFDNNIDISIRYQIVCHLLECAECYQEYEQYAKNEKLHFDIVREVTRVQLNRQEDIPDDEEKFMTKRTSSKVVEFKAPIIYKKNTKEDMENRWSIAHRFNDYSELMNIKAVRDIYNAENKTPDYGDNKKDFVDFLTKKVCQKVDFLEKCFKLEGKK